MKRLVLLLAVVVSFVAATAMKAALQPEFKFEKETHDFGKIPQGKPVNVTLKFKNVGDQPLIISSVEPACGCTVAKYTQTPVKKGESGFVELTYNAAAVGVFTKATTIKSNSKDPVKTVIIKGEVVAAATSK